MTGNHPDSIAALLLAAGQGVRLRFGHKAFLELAGVTLLRRAANLMASCGARVLAGVHEQDIERGRADLGAAAEVYPGGASRSETIRGLFERCSEDLIVIHDVVRPFASRELLRRVVDAALEHGAAAPIVFPGERVVRVERDFIQAFLARREGGIGQTPQAFRRPVLGRGLRVADAALVDPSPAELVLWSGAPVRVVAGEAMNIKITTSIDWQIARMLVESFDGNTLPGARTEVGPGA
ncbi:MAG: 2-C-methyl-D-erythritol 4-phosphate cytidylyltransferase [Armatimonadota bacterium]